MTRTALAIGIGLLLGILVAWVAFPRYTWRDVPQYPDGLLRVDRWTGQTTLGVVSPAWGRWVPVSEFRRGQ